MKHFTLIKASPSGSARTLMSAEALEEVTASLRKKMSIEDSPEGHLVSPDQIASADVVILSVNKCVEKRGFAKALIEAAVELGGMTEIPVVPSTIMPIITKFVVVAACSNGVAHSFLASELMVAESLRKAANALSYEIKIEIQSPIFTHNGLTFSDISTADVVIIVSDTNIETARFIGKRVYAVGTKDAICAGQDVLQRALRNAVTSIGDDFIKTNGTDTKGRGISKIGAELYKHLAKGVTHMLPMITTGGLCLSLAFAFGGISEPKEGSLSWAFNLIASGSAYQLFIAILSGFISFSIAKHPGLIPGLIGGMLAHKLNTGFLGGIFTGFFAGYLTQLLDRQIRLPMFEGLKAMLFLPFISSIIVGLSLIYLVAPPISTLTGVFTSWLTRIGETNVVLFGAFLGGMMALDLGGPVNKTAVIFALGLMASQVYTPMAAIMVAGMTPPLGIALTVLLFRKYFDIEDRKSIPTIFVMGLSYITEGAIPIAARDPLRVMPALILGSAVSGALIMVSGVEVLVPHGGIWIALCPGAIRNLYGFFVALIIGTLVTTISLTILKLRPLGSKP